MRKEGKEEETKEATIYFETREEKAMTKEEIGGG